MTDPQVVIMSDDIAEALGIPVVPFENGKPVPPAKPIASIIVQSMGVDGAVFWRFWPIDPKALEGAA